MPVVTSPNANRARAAGRSPERSTDRNPAGKQSRLSVVNARRLAERTQRRRARVIGLAAAGFIVMALLVIVTGQALVASQQVHLDNLNAAVTTATESNANLELRRAELTAPDTVLQVAQKTLHMVSPQTVTYLTPVQPGITVAEAAAAGQ